jgi:4-hydroxy-tetrahydrodipicolinate synthase
MELHGIFPYLVSPLDERGRVRADVLARLVRHLIDCGVHGLSPLGSTGEAPYLSPAQREAVVAATIAAADGRVPVVPAVTAFATAEAVAEAQRYRRAGAAALVVNLQRYFPLDRAAVRDFYRAVAAEVDCPLVLYANPALTGVDLTPDLLAELADLPNVRYFKDATGSTGRILSVLERTGGRLRAFAASAHVPLLVLQLGGVGWMAGPACLLPRECVRLYDLAVAGRWQEAWALQRRLWRLNEVFQRHALAACVKAGLQLQGWEVGAPLPPQRPLGADALAEVRAALAAAAGEPA